MSDGSNAWADKHEGDEEGQWVDKKAFSFPVIVYGQHFLAWRFPRVGSYIKPHTHDYEHSSILLQGTVILTGEAEGRNGIPVTAPDVVFFRAGVEHSIRAITAGVLLIHTYPKDFQAKDGGE